MDHLSNLYGINNIKIQSTWFDVTLGSIGAAPGGYFFRCSLYCIQIVCSLSRHHQSPRNIPVLPKEPKRGLKNARPKLTASMARWVFVDVGSSRMERKHAVILTMILKKGQNARCSNPFEIFPKA